MKFVFILLALCAVMLASPQVRAADAAEPVVERDERARMNAERSLADAEFALRERGCYQKFAVTACLDAARRERQNTLDRLRLRQDALDEAKRKRRAAQRIENIRSNVSTEEAKVRDSAVRQRQKVARQVGVAESSAAAASAGSAASAAQSAKSKVADPLRAQEYEQRQGEAQAHREAVARRNAEHAAKGKVAKPLPTPGAASAP